MSRLREWVRRHLIYDEPSPCELSLLDIRDGLWHPTPLPIHRTEAGYPFCATCDGGGCYDCTDPA